MKSDSKPDAAAKKWQRVTIGAGTGIVFGAALGYTAIGMVLGAAAGLFVSTTP